MLLKELPPDCRRLLLSERLTEWQRKDLETWATRQKDATKAPSSQPAKSERMGRSAASPKETEPDAESGDCVVGDCDVLEEFTSSESSDMEDTFVICDTVAADEGDFDAGQFAETCPEGAAAACRQGKQGVQIRGIQKKDGLYIAEAAFNFVGMRSRGTASLDKALDWLAILTAIASRSRKRRWEELTELKFEHVVQSVLSEYQDDSATNDWLRFFLQFSMRHWVGKILTTPTSTSLAKAGSWIHRFAALRSCALQKGLRLGDSLRQNWELFKQECGRCRRSQEVTLEGLEAGQAKERLAQIQRCIEVLVDTCSRSLEQQQAQAAKRAAEIAVRSRADRWKETRAKMRRELTCSMAEILGEQKDKSHNSLLSSWCSSALGLWVLLLLSSMGRACASQVDKL
ncbi:unnamed protein product [Polarella glacialis]|uniref:Uncharacterized protein n=1 Tax=Polarella glacialis TaxID=89957 RepID=A0A813I9Z2_POLGL|nr:unnamed protein product [Polarella glacialis]